MANKSHENFGFSKKKGSLYSVKGETIEKCIPSAKAIKMNESKFYISKKRDADRCSILTMEEISLATLEKEDGTNIFLYCS